MARRACSCCCARKSASLAGVPTVDSCGLASGLSDFVAPVGFGVGSLASLALFSFGFEALGLAGSRPGEPLASCGGLLCGAAVDVVAVLLALFSFSVFILLPGCVAPGVLHFRHHEPGADSQEAQDEQPGDDVA